MEKAKKMFVEFKSIFFSEDVLKENEKHANIVVASTMLNLFVICIIAFLLVYFNVFKVGMNVMRTVLFINLSLLAIPALICFLTKGNGQGIRIFLFSCFILAMAISDVILKYNVTLLMVLPIILAARYYNKKFTIWVSTLTCVLFLISPVLSIHYGQQDLNSYNLIIPKGTTITIDSTLRDAVTKVNIDEGQRVKNIYLHLILPKIFIYSIVSFACIQISQSGKKMIEKQIEITNKSSRLDTELNLAYNIQQGMLPSKFPAFPEHKEIDIYAMSKPAKEVGGDFYDMFLVDDNHLAICMADVSGKGIPAALFMMVSKILIDVITIEGGNVEEVITKVNNILSAENKLNLFVTAWFGILDLQTGKLEFVNAGHDCPYIYTRKTGRFELLKTKPNFVIAGMNNMQYQKHEYQLEPGDRLFLYTDGVVEATNKTNKMYGELRLQQFLDNNINLDAKDTIINLKKDIDKFANQATQFDDITMLELNYKNHKGDFSNISKEFKADIKELTAVQEFINTELKNKDVGTRTLNQINLAVEEIFVNIVKYAYQGKNGICIITINNKEDCIEFTFEDRGVPFNPLEQTPPNVSLSKDEREIGGLGIFLVEKTMDKVEYKYENNMNILKITKKIK